MTRSCKRTACLLLALVLCAGLLAGLGTTASAATLEERQQAIVAVAWAYYDKGHSVQYDGSTLVDSISRGDYGKTRSTNETSPETATPNETMYTVCSDFAHQVYYEAYRIQLTGNAGRCWTRTLAEYEPKEPATVWSFDEDKDPDREQALTQMFTIAQPGDVFTAYTATGGTGHTMVYVGDVLGDGKGYLLHSGGDPYKPADKKETREYNRADDPEIDERYGKSILTDGNGGSIRLSPAEEFIRSHYMKKTFNKLTLIRPLLEMTEDKYPMRPATAYRVSHPRLAIDRTLNKSRFNSVETGETVTMTLKLTNSSKQSYSVPVTEKTPAGAKLKTPFAGAKVAGETQTFDVQLAAGDSKTFTCEYEITAKRGEQVIFTDGSVGDIPSNTIPLTVGGKKLTAEENAKLAALAKGDFQVLKDANANNRTLGDVVWQKVLGLNVQLPDFKTVTKDCIKTAKTQYGEKQTNVYLKRDEVPAEKLTTYQTLVPTCWGGANLWCPYGYDRCADPRDKHLDPGDVIVRSESLTSQTASEQLVYLGEGKYLYYDRTKRSFSIVEEPEFVYCLSYKVFYVLRPTLAYDDVHNLPAITAPAAESKMKFTDVKESDWFFTYVRDLVEDGLVNGMTETTFVPQGTLTYGQALKLVSLAVGEAEPEKAGAHWASGYVKLAKSKKWITEDVNPDATITRLQFCKIAAKAKKITSQPASNPFDDTKDIDVLALYKAGVINGMSKNVFQPDGLLTRAQISKIICVLRTVK